jgi:poly(3-hydroxybutyrate) depolymerase
VFLYKYNKRKTGLKMKIIICLLVALISINTFAEDKKETLEFNGKMFGKILKRNIDYKEQEISYFTYIPLRNRGKNLYVVLHGEYSKSEDFFKMTNLHKSIIPQNTMLAFNSSAMDWFSNIKKNKLDKELIYKIIRKYKKRLDLENVYLIGYSSGATFANEIMCSGEVKIDGVANINGSISQNVANKCKNITNMRYLQAIGTADDYYTYQDLNNQTNQFKLPTNEFLTLDETNKKLMQMLNCPESTSFPIDDSNKDDNSTIMENNFLCKYKEKNKFKLLKFEKMGHTWPNNNSFDLSDFRGVVNKDINLNTIIIDYITKKH